MQMTENSLAWFLRSDGNFLFGSLKFLKILVAKILDSEDFWIRPSSKDLQILASEDLLTITECNAVMHWYKPKQSPIFTGMLENEDS